MSGRNRKELRHSKQVYDQGIRPTSAHAGGRNTPDPRPSSQPNVDPHFDDQPALEPRPSDESTLDLRRTTAPHRGGQRAPVPSSIGQRTAVTRSSILAPSSSCHPTVNPPLGLQSAPALSSSHESTPNLRCTTAPYRGGQRTPIPSSTGHRTAVPRSGGRPTVNPPSSPQSSPAPRSSRQPTPGSTTPHPGGLRTLVPSSSGQRAPVPRPSDQPIPRPRSSGHHTPNLRRIPDSHRGGQGTAVPSSSGQRTPAPRSRTPVSSSSRSRTINPHFGVQATPDPRTSGQSNPSQQRAMDPYGGQLTPRATSGGQHGPYSDPRFVITDPRFGGQPTPDQQRITDPYGSQRFPVPQPVPYPSSSGQPAPDRQRITYPYGGQLLLEATSGGYPGPYSSSQPTVDPDFGNQPITDPRNNRAPTPNQQRITGPYGGQSILEATSSGPRFSDLSTADPRFRGQPTSYQQPFIDPYGVQRLPVPEPTPYSSFVGQANPSQQRITDPYRGRPILEATSGGYPGPHSSSQPTVDPRFGDLSITDPRFSDQPTFYQQRITDPYVGQRLPVSQPTPFPRFSSQSPPNLPYIAGPYHSQPTFEATSGVHPVPHSSGQLINNGIYTITNVHHSLLVYLEDANDYSPLRGHHRPEVRSAQWHVRNYGNQRYSIENVCHNRYANSGPRAELKAFVEGCSRDQLWRIQATATGECTITTTDTRNSWMLPDDHPDTPVELSNVYTDRRCWWTFKKSEIGAPVSEHATAPPVLFEPKPLLAPSGGQPMPEAAIIEFTSVIAGAPDLLHPLRAACKALRVVVQRAENIGHVNEDREVLIKRLKFHLATVENHIAKLEEDQRIDGTIPALNQEVKELLETYARELEEIDGLLSVNQPEGSSLMDEVTSKTRKIDEVFQIYTIALHRFAASTVDQMRQQLARFQQESEKAHTVAEKARPIRPNANGIQHRECLQGTREKTLPAISNWADNKNAENWILFFLDVAGSGKSTVAKHMAEKWKREKRLLARFFFSRDTTTTMSTDSFCSTVANAFAVLDPEFKKHIDEVTKRPDLGLLSFEELFEALVVGPLRAIGRRAILIIDALDECHPEQRDQLLQTLRDQHSSLPFLRILATGRPERDIKHWAEEKFGFGYTNFMRLEESDKDVELYIKHTLKDLPIVQDRLYPVICHAEGLFIWARVACDLLLNSVNIDGLLQELGKEVSLDYLYKVALEQSTPKDEASRRAIIMVLQMILVAMEPLSIAELEMLSPNRAVVEKVVTSLGSVLLYQGREGPIRLLHATFREFLTAQSKADIFFIQVELGHHTLASGCLNTISHLLKQAQDGTNIRAMDANSQRRVISFEQDIY